MGRISKFVTALGDGLAFLVLAKGAFSQHIEGILGFCERFVSAAFVFKFSEPLACEHVLYFGGEGGRFFKK